MNRLNGFTLIELVTALAVAGVVLAIGVPSFQNYISNTRQTTAINDLAGALQLARNSAVSRRVRVTVCKSRDGASCETGSGSGDWSQGWIVFLDPDTPGTRDADEELLRVHTALPGNANFTGNTNVVNRVSFSPQGLARGSNGTLTYCDSRGEQRANALVISVGGQVRQAQDTNNDGIVEDGNGDNISC